MESLILPKKLLTVRNYNKYYTSMVNNKHCMFGFNNKETAHQCSLFLSEYSHRYGKWPGIDVNENDKAELALIEPNKRRPLLNILYNDIYIHESEIEELQCLCLICNMELLYITDFGYTINNNKIDIDFKAAILDIEKTEYTDNYIAQLYISMLTSLFDINE